MPSFNVQIQGTMGSVTAINTITGSEDAAVLADPTLSAAKTGALTTRTNDTTGTLTMDTGHGITTGARLDIYWTGGKRVGVTVGTVATNSVPFSSGSGDNLPADESAITAMVPSVEPFAIGDTSDLQGLLMSSNTNSTAVLITAGNDVVATLAVTGTFGGYIWEPSIGTDNPLDAETTTASVYLSHGDSSASQQVSLIALLG